MEGPENMRAPSRLRQQLEQIVKNKKAFLIILFHLIGLVGLIIPLTRPLFLTLVPWHLLFMLIVIVSDQDGITPRFLFFALLIFVIALGVEWIGVHQHWLFGDYHYGKTLGYQLSGVPLIIGVNWFLLTYSAGVLMQRSRIKHSALRIIIGASLLLLLDILIEPVAVRFDYWHWSNGGIPITNYVCWFFVSALMLSVFEMFRFRKQGIAGPVLLIMQFVFFGILCLVQTIFLP